MRAPAIVRLQTAALPGDSTEPRGTPTAQPPDGDENIENRRRDYWPEQPREGVQQLGGQVRLCPAERGHAERCAEEKSSWTHRGQAGAIRDDVTGGKRIHAEQDLAVTAAKIDLG